MKNQGWIEKEKLSHNKMEKKNTVDFSQAFDSIPIGMLEQKLLAHGFPKENVAAIMMLYKNTKVKVCSPNGDMFLTWLQVFCKGISLALYLFFLHTMN